LTRAALDEYLRAHHMTARVVTQMSSNEAIKQAVMAGMGVSLLSLLSLHVPIFHPRARRSLPRQTFRNLEIAARVIIEVA